MILCRSNNYNSRIRKNKYFSKTKYRLTFFAVISTKPGKIVFKQRIDKIKYVNRNYVTQQSYDCSNATDKTNSECPLSLMTGATTVAGEAES